MIPIPIGHQSLQSRRLPLITIALIIINLAAFLLTRDTLARESPELPEVRTHIRLLAATHPELNLPPTGRELINDIQKREPSAWALAKSPTRDLYDAWDARMRMSEDPEWLQQEMDRLCARYDRLKETSVLERWAFVPAHPTWYSYVTANFLHGGWIHIIGNMWLLWLAGIVLEDAWGRALYLMVYLVGGAVALQAQALFEAGSNIPTIGASGAVAALMGAFLIRFPTIEIDLLWLVGLRFYRLSAAAYWLLPLWLLMELFYGWLSGSSDGVAHMAHVGGFIFGGLAALAIKFSKLENVINRGIEAEIDPTYDSHLDAIQDLIAEGKTDDALFELKQFFEDHKGNERALLMTQEIYWRQHNVPEYGRVTQELCGIHLAQRDTTAAIKDYEDLVAHGGGLPTAEMWLKLCAALEEKQEFERAAGEYQELAEAYPKERHSLTALMAAARLVSNKLKRPQQALLLYRAVASSPVPHLDLDPMVQAGIRNAQAALQTNSPATS